MYRKSKNVANRDVKNLNGDATALVGHCRQLPLPWTGGGMA